eukprot:3100299-Amphidinium_carterae.2
MAAIYLSKQSLCRLGQPRVTHSMPSFARCFFSANQALSSGLDNEDLTTTKDRRQGHVSR